MEVTEKIFETAFLGFNNIGEKNVDRNVKDFKKHPLILKHEIYKYNILEEAKNELLLKTWKETELGSGRILNCVKNAINIKINNLIDWRKQDDFKKLEPNFKNEKLLYDFFKSKSNDEISFSRFYDIGFSYQLIAYLFFLKNHQKYLPISQEQFDKIFESLELDFKTNHNCSWENYLQFNEIIKQFKKHLSQRFQNVSLLDSHSFLWIYGFPFGNTVNENKKKQETTKKKNQKKEEFPKEKPLPELKIYQPKKIVDLDNFKESENEVDYLEIHRKQMEVGDLAEKIVYESEINFLKQDFPHLAKEVRIVSSNPAIGCDIVSFEIDGTQKQIEVKAISLDKNKKSFIITRNELLKSKTFKNYYVYCVSDLYSENPEIRRIKKPNFEDSETFLMEPINFKITFE